MKINIFKATANLCVVDQATLDSTKGDTADWFNNTGGDVIVFFPHDNVLGGPHFHHKIKDQHTYSSGSATKQAPSGTAYPYAIYCAVTGTFAVGGSDPEIIVM